MYSPVLLKTDSKRLVNVRLLDNRQGNVVARAVNSGVRYDPSAETEIPRKLAVGSGFEPHSDLGTEIGFGR